LSLFLEETSFVFQITASITFLGLVCYILFLIIIYSFILIAIALRNCSSSQALHYSRKQISSTIPVRLLASYLLVWLCTSFVIGHLFEFGLGAIDFIKPNSLFSVASILIALLSGFIDHIFTINQVFLFLNTDYLQGRSTMTQAIEPDPVLLDTN
ncbi:MAG: hypothetical protein AAGG51_30985, partial [Cyanobacteria bacterium P01_G01_bin.54]